MICDSDQAVKRINAIELHTTLWKLSDIFLGNRIRFGDSGGVMDGCGGLFSCSLCFVKASIQGILTRIAVSALYTPSVFLAAVVPSCRLVEGQALAPISSREFTLCNIRNIAMRFISRLEYSHSVSEESRWEVGRHECKDERTDTLRRTVNGDATETKDLALS